MTFLAFYLIAKKYLSKLFFASLILFVLISPSIILKTYVTDAATSLAIERAEGAVINAYQTISQVERAGGEENDLIDRINWAVSIPDQVQVHFQMGNYNEAVHFADLRSESASEVVTEATITLDAVIEAGSQQFWLVVTNSIIASCVIVCVSFLVWRGFVRRHHQRIEWKAKLKFEYVFLGFAILALTLSIIYQNTILTFIGLSLSLWGGLLLYVRPEGYVKKEVMESMSTSSLEAIDQITSELNLEGAAVYVPFQRELYLKYNLGFQNEFVYISKKNVETRDMIIQAFMQNGEGLRLSPTGLGLADLIQEKSGRDFQNLDLDSLADVLPPIITRELGIAEEFEMRVEENKARIRITKPITQKFCKETSHLSPNVGCPICSSIACILTRTTIKPLTIEKCLIRNNTIEAQFHIFELTD